MILVAKPTSQPTSLDKTRFPCSNLYVEQELFWAGWPGHLSGLPEAFGSFPEPPGASRSFSRSLPEFTKASWSLPGASRASRSLPEPSKASRSFAELLGQPLERPGAPRSLPKPEPPAVPKASRSLLGPPGAFRSFPEP